MRNVRVIIEMEVDLQIQDNQNLEDVIERFQPGDSWQSGDIWCTNYTIGSYYMMEDDEGGYQTTDKSEGQVP